jgi:hypothetical protein
METWCPNVASVDEDAEAGALDVIDAIEVVVVIVEAVVGFVLSFSWNVTWPNSILNCSHHRPTAVKSAMVFPVSSLTVMPVGFIVVWVICMFEMRNPSLRTSSVVPHQYRAGTETSWSSYLLSIRVIASIGITSPCRPPESDDRVPKYPILVFPWAKALKIR